MTDKTAFKRLFYQYYGEMFHLAQTVLYADDEAEDVVQDVFAQLVKNNVLPAKDKEKAYLMRAVCNGCINRIKQKNLKEKAIHLYSLEVESDWQHIEERLTLLADIYDYANTHLAEPHRTIFRLRFEEGMKLKEIALQLDMNLKTVFKYLSQSIQDIQKKFIH